MARFNYDAPPELERIIRKCLQKDPGLRYQSARELVIDLKNLLSEAAAAPATVLSAPAGGGMARPLSVLDAAGAGCLASKRDDFLNDSDVFLSYAGVDDQPVLEGQTGWVSQFFRNLEVRIAQLSGEAIRIVPHSNPLGEAKADERALAQASHTKAMISVLSPPFLKSSGCRREVEEFWRSAERSGTLEVGNKSRIFKVVKTPVDDREMPPHLSGLFQGLSSFEFFEKDAESGRLKEFSEVFGEEARRRFLERIYDLAFEVNHVLKRYDPAKPADRIETLPRVAGKAVYLAETTSDMQEARNRIKRELQERGFRVLPEAPLPSIASEIEAKVRECLGQSDAVVLPVGGRYGMVPEGARESVLEMQARLSGEAGGRAASGRFIWIPPDVNALDERQAAFIDSLERTAAGMKGTELLRGPLEQLKTLVLKRLTAPPPAPKIEPASDDEIQRVYLICERQDEEAVEPIEDHLYELGFEVKTPAFDGSEEAFVQMHQENLRLCDAVLIYFGQASSQWVEMKLMDLLKAPGYGRTRPWLAQAVYVAPPEHRRKERFRSHAVEVIRETNGFESGLLEGFVRRMNEKA